MVAMGAMPVATWAGAWRAMGLWDLVMMEAKLAAVTEAATMTEDSAAVELVVAELGAVKEMAASEVAAAVIAVEVAVAVIAEVAAATAAVSSAQVVNGALGRSCTPCTCTVRS